MPVLICLRKELWTGLISVGDQVPTCPVFTRAKIKSRLGILDNLPSHQSPAFPDYQWYHSNFHLSQFLFYFQTRSKNWSTFSLYFNNYLHLLESFLLASCFCFVFSFFVFVFVFWGRFLLLFFVIVFCLFLLLAFFLFLHFCFCIFVLFLCFLFFAFFFVCFFLFFCFVSFCRNENVSQNWWCILISISRWFCFFFNCILTFRDHVMPKPSS